MHISDDPGTDVPCSAEGFGELMTALFVRVRHRLEPPQGFQLVMPGRPAATTVKVLVELPQGGEPLAVSLSRPSGVEALDRAVLAALEKARCMPAPPARLIDAKTSTFRITQAYGFDRTN
jgi:TonB family protein